MMAKKKALGIIISVLGMAALLTACQRQKGGRDINFPAYKVENPQGIFHYDQINETAGFSVNAELPKNWTIKKENGDEDVPPGELYTPVYIYEGDRLIGYIGFNIFEPYTEEIPQELYYQTVWPSLRLSSLSVWEQFTSIKTTDKGETGIAEIHYKDPSEVDNPDLSMAEIPELESIGILSYDRDLKVYVGIAFMPDTVTKEQAEAIARSIKLDSID